MNSTKTFHVGVKGVIVEEGKVLLLKKNADNSFWKVPGGRMNEAIKITPDSLAGVLQVQASITPSTLK